MSKTHKVCEKHFDECDIEREYVTKLTDGTIHRIKRQRIGLKKYAVPSKLLSKDNIDAINCPENEAVNDSYVMKRGFINEHGFKGFLKNYDFIRLPSAAWWL